MKIYGQGLVNSAEKFLHAFYISASGSPADLALETIVFLAPLFFIMFLIAALVLVGYHVLRKYL